MSNGIIATVRVLCDTDIRSEADHNSGFIKNAHKGELYNVIAHVNPDWHRVILDNKGNSGWIDGNKGNNLELIKGGGDEMQVSDGSYSMRDYASQAASQVGWDAGLVYAQWVLETGNFTSSVFAKDNNLAGIKWVSAKNNPGASGPGVKANDGGYYAHYPNLTAGVQGYVNFIKANPRYANVKTGRTLAEQAQLLKNDGWATDPNYVSKVLSIASSGGGK